MEEVAVRRVRLLRLAVVVALLLLPVAATVHSARSGPHLHDVRLGLSGPPLAVQPVADASAASGEHDVDVRLLTQRPTYDDAVAAARRDLRTGVVDAEVVVDIRRSHDTLLVPATRSDAFVDAVAAHVGQISAGYGRTASVERVEPTTGADAPRALPHLLVVFWAVAGLLAAAGLCAWRGPPTSVATGVRDLGILGAAGLLGAGGTAAVAAVTSAPVLPLLVPSFLAVVVFAWLTMGFVALLDVWGLAVATGLLLGPVLPLLLGRDPELLPSPWYDVRAVLPHDAALKLADGAVFGTASVDLQALSVLLVWALVAVITAVLALHAVERVRGRSIEDGSRTSVGS